MNTEKPAVVLLSGGLDSATVLAIALEQGFRPVTLSFRYGQRHSAEIAVAARIAKTYGIARHVVADIDLRAFGGSALTADIDVPKHRSDAEIGDGIPITYVPARNTVFLSFALALAETTQAYDVFIGVNALDYSGYPDCRPAYVKAFENVMNLATRAGVEGTNPFTLHTPLIDMSKADIVKRGTALGVNYADTLSCYDPTPDGLHCGSCDACHLRQKGFREAGIPDPTNYADE
ncbi:MAG: 7-cyano-7-deazaguanine synthase QueC [Rhodospirillales bacterium]|jgi:7-cyano-7-deazaguanine synthase|nr:7-cyano-7-deazaguanine synthase QueC [Rhodospirillales bacterium]